MLEFGLLADHPEVLAPLSELFVAEWPHWYGPGGRGDAGLDLLGFSQRDHLPLAVVAWQDGDLCGAAALKAQSMDALPDWGPWVAAGYVVPERRRQGVGAQLLLQLEREALRLGHDTLYCGTATAGSLMLRCGWTRQTEVQQHGQAVAVYRKVLRS